MHPNATSRRIVESAVAALLLVITLPVTIAVAVISAWCYRSSPLFVHERVGYRGQTIRFMKIRTLSPTVGQYSDKYSLPRDVPPAMQLVRRLHLDELPQLLHVLRGEMSFVGPRPEMHVLHDALPESFAQERTSVLPGITGLWQISTHSTGLISERPEYDTAYTATRTRLLDLWILYRTVIKMVSGRTVTLESIPAWAIASPTRVESHSAV